MTHPHDFPLSALPYVPCQFVTALSHSLSLDPAMIALQVLTVAGAAVGNSRRLAVTEEISTPASLWSAAMAPPDLQLDRARQFILAPLIERQQRRADHLHFQHAQHAIDLQSWSEFDRKGRRPTPFQPIADSQFFFTDPDFRQIPSYLLRCPRGCLIFASSLIPWFQTAASNAPSIFDAGPCTFDRAPFLARFTPNAFVAISGLLSPETLHCSHLGPLAGLILARFLLVRPEIILPSTTPRQSSPILGSSTRADWDLLIMRLSNIEPQPNPRGRPRPVLAPLQPEARRLLLGANHRLRAAALAADDLQLRNHLLGLIEYLPRLALILRMISLVDERGPLSIHTHASVDPAAMRAAIRLIDWFFAHTRRIYSDLASDTEARKIITVLTLIAGRGGAITTRQLMQASRSFRDSAAHAKAYLQNLAAEGFGHFSFNSRSNPKSPIFRLDPAVYGNNPPAGNPPEPQSLPPP